MTDLTAQQRQVIADLRQIIARRRDGATGDGIIRATLIAEGWPVAAVDQAMGQMTGEGRERG